RHQTVARLPGRPRLTLGPRARRTSRSVAAPVAKPPARSDNWGPLGVLIQLVAALVVTMLLIAGIEFVSGYLVPDENSLASVKDDYVATTIKVLELAPDINPTPLVTDQRLLWRNKPGAHKTQAVNPQILDHPADWTIDNNSRGYRGPELEHEP